MHGGALHLERCSPLTTSREPAPRSAAARGSAVDAPPPVYKANFPQRSFWRERSAERANHHLNRPKL